jgi:hypothetical protein
MRPQKPPPNPVRRGTSQPNRKPSRQAHVVFTNRQARFRPHLGVEDSRVHAHDADGRVLDLQEGDQVPARHFGGRVGAEVGEDADVRGEGVEGDEGWGAGGGGGFVGEPGPEGEEGAFDVYFCLRGGLSAHRMGPQWMGEKTNHTPSTNPPHPRSQPARASPCIQHSPQQHQLAQPPLLRWQTPSSAPPHP